MSEWDHCIPFEFDDGIVLTIHIGSNDVDETDFQFTLGRNAVDDADHEPFHRTRFLRHDQGDVIVLTGAFHDGRWHPHEKRYRDSLFWVAQAIEEEYFERAERLTDHPQ